MVPTSYPTMVATEFKSISSEQVIQSPVTLGFFFEKEHLFLLAIAKTRSWTSRTSRLTHDTTLQPLEIIKKKIPKFSLMGRRKVLLLTRKKMSPEQYIPAPLQDAFHRAIHICLYLLHTSLNRPNVVLSVYSVYFFK